MKDTDIAWIAGLFEGEGNISLWLPSHGSGHTSVLLGTSDRDVVERLDRLFPSRTGLKVHKDHTRPQNKDQHVWKLGDSANQQRFLRMIMPLLGQRRLAKAQEVVAWLESRPYAKTLTIEPIPMLSVPSSREIDVAWAAGLFEGEGCISYGVKRGNVIVQVRMTDRDIIERLHAVVPCPKIGIVLPKSDHHKTQYRWTLTAPDRIREFLNMTLPYFGERRSTRAQELLAFLDTRPGRGARNGRKTHCPKGHEYTPENTTPIGPDKTWRACRTCNRNYMRARKRLSS
jgi:hypothetical protein